MIFLPIVQRELRAAARRRGVYMSRIACAIAALGVGSWIMLLNRYEDPQSLGPVLFVSLAVVVFLYTSTGALNCDCLSVEKREGTMGLLFLTDLRGYDVVLGKLAATSVSAFYGMLAVVPILAIPILLGAVGIGEFCRVSLVSANLMFFFLSAGIFSSAVCREDSRGLGVAAVIAALLMLVIPWSIYYAAYRVTGSHADVIWTISPVFDCFLAFDDPTRSGRPTFQNHPGWFWGNVAATQIYSWFFLVAACLIVPRSWQDRSVSRSGFRGGLLSFFKWSAESRAKQRRQLLEINPFLWRVARGPLKRMFPWVFLVFVAGVWIWVHKPMGLGWLNDEEDVFWVLFLHVALKYWVAADACRALAEDRRSGSLELLLTTSLSEDQIVRGQLLALWRKFGGPGAVVLLIDAVLLGLLLRRHGSVEDYQAWTGIFAAAGVLLVADMIALSWMSMWLGLSGRKPNRATLMSFSAIVVLPSAFFWVALTVAEMVLHPDLTVGELIVTWVVLGLFVDGFFGVRSREKLLGRFREILSREPAKSGSKNRNRSGLAAVIPNTEPVSNRG
jgi:ABC-type transport system involved in multi-copper enzyme maturation permease subunit